LVFAIDVSGSAAGAVEVSSTEDPRIIATNATADESGDQRIVSGKCTAMASAVTFFRILPSAVYMSSRNSAGMSPAL
jgi:hypothetical protein